MKIKEQLLTVMFLNMILLFSTAMYAQEKEMNSTNSVVYNPDDASLEWGGCPDFMPNGCQITVLHGDPAQRNADILFKVPANTVIPNHTHTSAERMILISGEMEVTYEGETPQKLKKGTYAFGPPQKPHSARCGDAGPCVLFIAFEEPVDAFEVKN